METIDNTTLVTATGGHHHGPSGWGSPPFVPYAYAAAAPRWAYAGSYMGYAPAPMPARWAPMPAAWWPAYR
jgi:hypothetical protein